MTKTQRKRELALYGGAAIAVFDLFEEAREIWRIIWGIVSLRGLNDAVPSEAGKWWNRATSKSKTTASSSSSSPSPCCAWFIEKRWRESDFVREGERHYDHHHRNYVGVVDFAVRARTQLDVQTCIFHVNMKRVS